MWNYIKNKLGVNDLHKAVDQLSRSIPALDARNRQVLTSVESAIHILKTPTADDGMVMFHLRCMGCCGGWEIKKRPGGDVTSC